METKQTMYQAIDRIVNDIEKTKSIVTSLHNCIEQKLSLHPDDTLCADMKESIEIIGTRLEGIETFVQYCKVIAEQPSSELLEELDVRL